MTNRIHLAGFFLLLLLAPLALAEPISIEGQAGTVRVDAASGDYTVTRRSTNWFFTGTVGLPLVNAATTKGSDSLGAYAAVAFDWEADGPKTGEIRAYTARPLVLFMLTCRSAQAKPPAAFPSLKAPLGLSLFSYTETVFAVPKFTGNPGATPWLMFDDAAHAAILSPASNFMIASIHTGKPPEELMLGVEGGDNRIGGGRAATTPATLTVAVPATRPAQRPPASGGRVNRDRQVTDDHEIASGFVAKLQDVPQGFTHQTILTFGDGIGATWDTWGRAMTDLTGKKRPTNDADAGLKYFGYWTDNGAGYYYNYDLEKGYAGTLLALRKRFDELGIPLGYLQLDSWWYAKSNMGPEGKTGDVSKNRNLPRGSWNMYGGLLDYTAHKDLFPEGLPAFRQQVGLPFITHNRWVDLNSPYREKYKISGVAAVDPKWWDDVVDYLKSSGVITYEQDWLDRIYKYSPEFQTTPGVADAFLDNMARACRERGLTVQYCMGLPRHYLQGTRYDNLTTVRVSNDHFQRNRWEVALYVSQMASSLGEWPWVDTFNSRETSNLILATLTAGMVGVGDLIKDIDAANIRKAIRADGVLVKPDSAIVPIDQTWLDDASGKESPMIAAAYTDHGAGIRTAYVFAYPRNDRQMDIRFRPSQLGIAGDAWVYNAIDGSARKVTAGEVFDATFKDGSSSTAWAYYIVAPVARGGIALIGDKDRIASMGRQRIEQVQEMGQGLSARLITAPGEKQVLLHGFASSAPQLTAEGGNISDVSFDAASGRFSALVSPSSDGAVVTVQLSSK